ncbi:MAG: hypothetical protein M3Y71_05310 [Actinomycetota bacterium]|nr:hypothetical protein [Actinomycetota bacterium]
MTRNVAPGPVTGPPGREVLGVERSTVTRVLTVMLAFGAVSALAGLVIAIPGGGAGFPVSELEGTPFTSFVVPGLLLGVVIGGTQLAAAVAVARSRGTGPLLAGVAGFGMLVWIFTELAMIGYSVLQTVYFVLGLLELMLVLLLLGVVPPSRRRAR